MWAGVLNMMRDQSFDSTMLYDKRNFADANKRKLH